jgi:hypothetical protein
MSTYGRRQKQQVNEGPHHAMSTTITLLPATIRTATEHPGWLTTDHCATPVLDLLGRLNWAITETPDANVHCTSPDGRAYVGWLPEDPTAWARGILWTVRVQPTDAPAWTQEFGPATPAEAVAGFLAALIAASTH